MRKLLRLLVMSLIRHTEEYYQMAAKSRGIEYSELTHQQIALWVATLKQIEADLLIEMAFAKERTRSKDFDFSKLIK